MGLDSTTSPLSPGSTGPTGSTGCTTAARRTGPAARLAPCCAAALSCHRACRLAGRCARCCLWLAAFRRALRLFLLLRSGRGRWLRRRLLSGEDRRPAQKRQGLDHRHFGSRQLDTEVGWVGSREGGLGQLRRRWRRRRGGGLFRSQRRRRCRRCRPGGRGASQGDQAHTARDLHPFEVPPAAGDHELHEEEQRQGDDQPRGNGHCPAHGYSYSMLAAIDTSATPAILV